MPPRPTTTSTEAAEDRVIFPEGEWGGGRERQRKAERQREWRGQESERGKRGERASERVCFRGNPNTQNNPQGTHPPPLSTGKQGSCLMLPLLSPCSNSIPLTKLIMHSPEVACIPTARSWPLCWGCAPTFQALELRPGSACSTRDQARLPP